MAIILSKLSITEMPNLSDIYVKSRLNVPSLKRFRFPVMKRIQMNVPEKYDRITLLITTKSK